jgi:hypothetical protein
MLLPATISDEPGRNMRPAISFTCGRNARPCSLTPRMLMLAGLPESRLGRLINTMTSFEARGLPRPS